MIQQKDTHLKDKGITRIIVLHSSPDVLYRFIKIWYGKGIGIVQIQLLDLILGKLRQVSKQFIDGNTEKRGENRNRLEIRFADILLPFRDRAFCDANIVRQLPCVILRSWRSRIKFSAIRNSCIVFTSYYDYKRETGKIQWNWTTL